MIRKLAIAGLLTLAAIANANAAVIFDGSPNIPDDHAYGDWVNLDQGQNFVVKVDFASAVQITGFDLYVGYSDNVAGAPVDLKIFSQSPQLVPGATPASYFSTITDLQDFDFHAVNIAHADFSPITLAAGEYWIGMSGVGNSDFGWSSYFTPNDIGERPMSDQIQLAGNAFATNPGIHDLAFKIDGAFISAVPEPATWALFILGFGFVGAALRAGRNCPRAARATG